MLRAEVAAGSPIGREAKAVMESGQLVSDDIIIRMLGQRVERAGRGNGFILDGFPRTVPQAEALDRLLADKRMKLDAVIELRWTMRRWLTGSPAASPARSAAPATMTRSSRPPWPASATCAARTEFTRRADDNRETVVARLDAYHRQTAPILPHYAAQGILQPGRWDGGHRRGGAADRRRCCRDSPEARRRRARITQELMSSR